MVNPAFRYKQVRKERAIFHNKDLEVVVARVEFDSIRYWPDNFRTELSFDLLKKKYRGKNLGQLPLRDVVFHLADEPEMAIPELAESIKKNGVRVPLILKEDGTLLDGNRRYFACGYLKYRALDANETPPPVINDIPAHIVSNKDVRDRRTTLMILAEANYVSDFKVDWPLGVKARVIHEYAKKLRDSGQSEGQMYEEILSVFGVDERTAKAYLETMDITRDFVKKCRGFASVDNLRVIAQSDFVYFWEFRNKSAGGRNPLSVANRRKARTLFFQMMATEKFKNLKQVEPMLRTVTDCETWNRLTESGGTNIDQVEAIYKTHRAFKTAEDRIRTFYSWLKASRVELTGKSVVWLERVGKLCLRTVRRHGRH